MLGRAIQDHHPGLPGLKGTTLSQHYQANAKGNALKPVPATALNATIPSWSHSSNPLKRTASQASGHESLYGSQEQAPRKKAAIDLTQTSVVGGRVGKLHDIVSFDENDFDDDADIDLDEEVSPSVSKGFPTQSLSTLGPELFETDSSRTLLADSSQEKPATPRTTASSTALPWSSSPLSHVQARPPTKAATTEAPAAKAPQRRTLPWLEDSGEQVEGSAQSSPTDHVPDDLRAEIQQYAAKDAASGARGKTAGKKAMPDFVRKKMQQAKDAKAAQTDGCERFMASEAPVKFKSQRGIPKFVQKKMQQAQDGKAARAAAGEPFKSKRDIPDFVQKKMQQAQDGKATRAVADGQFTPLPNDKGSSKFPWNTTASAVKEQQKQLRQGHRKLIKDHEGGEVAKSNSKKRKEAVNKVFLSNEQKSVLDLVVDKNKSVFFTGSAGTGKSVLLREIIQVLRSRYNRETDRVAVTASTGLAACNVGGVTLHSFAGIGLGKEAVPELVRKIKKNPKARHRWMRTKILVVDEISMVDGDLFDKLESIARAMRNNGRPFGGIQLVITGDFFQLPPVPDYGRVSKFSFDAATWNTSVEHTIGLTQVFRQKDPGKASLQVRNLFLTTIVFANMLNEMRLGKLTSNSINAFRALNRPLSFSDDFEATEL